MARVPGMVVMLWVATKALSFGSVGQDGLLMEVEGELQGQSASGMRKSLLELMRAVFERDTSTPESDYPGGAFEGIEEDSDAAVGRFEEVGESLDAASGEVC